MGGGDNTLGNAALKFEWKFFWGGGETLLVEALPSGNDAHAEI